MEYDWAFTHRWMLRDSVRTEAFRRAIEAMVRPGDVVLDVGAGTGILSLFAARAGARTVYAVEQSNIAEMARKLVQQNGLSDTIRVLEADIHRVDLPEQVDLIVSEWLGTLGVDENLLPMVIYARDRWLKPDGKLIPAELTTWMAPVQLPMRVESGYFKGSPYGFDLSPLAEPSVHELLYSRRRVRLEDKVAIERPLFSVTPAALTWTQSNLPWRGTPTFLISNPNPVHALAAWFSAVLAPGITLTNAPEAPETHWGQLLLPLSREIQLERGALLDVQFTCFPRVPGSSDLAWSVRKRGEQWEHQDTRLTSPFTSPERIPLASVAASRPNSKLVQFLARLSVDPIAMAEFVANPDDAIKQSALIAVEKAALWSRDEERIHWAIHQYDTGMGAANPQRKGADSLRSRGVASVVVCGETPSGRAAPDPESRGGEEEVEI